MLKCMLLVVHGRIYAAWHSWCMLVAPWHWLCMAHDMAHLGVHVCVKSLIVHAQMRVTLTSLMVAITLHGTHRACIPHLDTHLASHITWHLVAAATAQPLVAVWQL